MSVETYMPNAEERERIYSREQDDKAHADLDKQFDELETKLHRALESLKNELHKGDENLGRKDEGDVLSK